VCRRGASRACGIQAALAGQAPLHATIPHFVLRWLEQAQADALLPVLTPAYQAVDSIYAAHGRDDYIDGFSTFLEVFVSVYLVAFVVFMGGVFLPQVRATNNDIRTKRAMLLLLPPQVVRTVKSIRELVDEILADDATGMGRNTQLSSRAMATLATFTKEREEAARGAGGGGGGGRDSSAGSGNYEDRSDASNAV
jgi:hypothetical protein